MSEYTWDDSMSDWIDKKIKSDSLPKRIAITKTAALTRRNSAYGTQLLLWNPHPESWNNWQFPYISITEPWIEPQIHTFGELSAVLKRTHTLLSNSPELELKKLEKVIGVSIDSFEPKPVAISYSLKYSKSATVWTAYIFAYHIGHLTSNGVLQAQHEWLALRSPQTREALVSGTLNNLPLADNVIQFMRSKTFFSLE